MFICFRIVTVLHSANNDFEGLIGFLCRKKFCSHWLFDPFFDLDFDRDEVSCGLLENVCPVKRFTNSLYNLFLFLMLVLTVPVWSPWALLIFLTILDGVFSMENLRLSKWHIWICSLKCKRTTHFLHSISFFHKIQISYLGLFLLHWQD